MKTTLSFVLLGFGALLLAPAALAAPPYEVWAIDQSNSPGKVYGGTLYIYDGKSLENLHSGAQRARQDRPRRCRGNTVLPGWY